MWKEKCKLFGHVTDHALYCSKIDPTKYLKWFEALKFAGAIGVHWLVPVLLLLERS